MTKVETDLLKVLSCYESVTVAYSWRGTLSRTGLGDGGVPDNIVGVALLERLCRSDVYGELPREKCSWAYRSTPISLFPASIAMFSAVLPSYNKKILRAKHAANHTITQMDTRCKGTLLFYVFIVFYFKNNILSWQHLHRRFKCSGMWWSVTGFDFPLFWRITVASSSKSSND